MKYEVTEEMIDERIAAMAWCLFEDFDIVDVEDALEAEISWAAFEMIKSKDPLYAQEVKVIHAYAVRLIERKFTRSEIRDEILEDLMMDEMERRGE